MAMLNGLSAIITGSTSGIGLSIARSLASEGCNVVLNGLKPHDQVESLLELIGGLGGGRAIYCRGDVSQPEAVRHMMASAEEVFRNGIDILVNNAGIQHTAPIESFPRDRWRSILDVNLSGVFYMTQAALPGMKRRNFGRIINIASVHGLVGSRDKSAYVAAKHGVVGLTKVVALECADYNITCNAICPGWVDTPLVRHQIAERAGASGSNFDDETRRLLGEKQPNERFVRAEEIGALAQTLARRDLRSTTGMALTMDGGWTAQ